jgi:hypothetical protein
LTPMWRKMLPVMMKGLMSNRNDDAAVDMDNAVPSDVQGLGDDEDQQAGDEEVPSQNAQRHQGSRELHLCRTVGRYSRGGSIEPDRSSTWRRSWATRTDTRQPGTKRLQETWRCAGTLASPTAPDPKCF